MIQTMSIEQILNAAHSDIVRQINKGTFKGTNGVNDNEENFYTITSLYSQWAENQVLAEEYLWRMYEEYFGDYLIEY